MSDPLHRFEEFERMTDAERTGVMALGDAARRYKRRTKIRSEGAVPTGFYILIDGWVAASHTVPDGGRQIFKVHLPGDALGTPSMCMARTVEELTALTDVVVVSVPFKAFGRMFDDHPRVAARFMLSIQLERIALMDRLAAMGRTTAEACLAALIIDLLERLDPIGEVVDDTFDLKLTQEQIADVLGITPIHVNRILAQIEERGLIRRSNRRITVLDRPALTRLAARPARVRAPNLDWLPASRH